MTHCGRQHPTLRQSCLPNIWQCDGCKAADSPGFDREQALADEVTPEKGEDALDWLLNYCEARQYGNGADWHKVEAARKVLADLRAQLAAERERADLLKRSYDRLDGSYYALMAESTIAQTRAEQAESALADARKENERLRGALERVALLEEKTPYASDHSPGERALKWCGETACAALSSPPSGT